VVEPNQVFSGVIMVSQPQGIQVRCRLRVPVFLQLLGVLHHQVKGHVTPPERCQDVCFGLQCLHIQGHQVQRKRGIHKVSWAWPSGHFNMARFMQDECQLIEALRIQFVGISGFFVVFSTVVAPQAAKKCRFCSLATANRQQPG
jgi:hypothetical protein